MAHYGRFAWLALLAAAGIARSTGAQTPSPQSSPPDPSASVLVLDAAPMKVGRGAKNLAPVPFTTPAGRKGWRVAIPGGRTLATPAVSDGKILIGGGFGSPAVH